MSQMLDPLSTGTAAGGRNLVVCCDGTSNQFSEDRTNVARLCRIVLKDRDRQLVYYHPGVGTKAPPGFVTGIGTKLAKLAGLAFGYGLKRDIVDAYVFVMTHFRPGDRLFIFGFSRGAYTARALVALIKMYGLLMPGNDALVPYLVDMFWAIDKARKNKDRRNAYFKLAAESRQELATQDCRPHFVGVWDTVSSVGWIGSPTALLIRTTIPISLCCAMPWHWTRDGHSFAPTSPRRRRARMSGSCGSRASMPTSAAATRKLEAPCRESRWAGCSRKRKSTGS